MPRLSLVQNPVMSQDVTSAQAWLMPYKGNDCAGLTIPDGGLSRSLSGLTLPQDLCVGLVNGAPALVTVPWDGNVGGGTSQQILTGTPIGGMTAFGGISAPFGSSSSVPYALGARSPGTTSGFNINSACGLSLPARTQLVSFQAWSPNDNGWLGDNSATTWEFLASNTNDISTGVVLASGSGAAGIAQIVGAAFTDTTPYQYFWFVTDGRGHGAYLGHLEVTGLVTTVGKPARTVQWAWQGGWSRNAGAVVGYADGVSPLGFAPGTLEKRGTVWPDDGGGTASRKASYGFDRYCGLMNDYNRLPLALVGGDPSPPVNGHFAYSPAQGWDGAGYHFYPVRGNILIRLRLFSGAQDQSITVRYKPARFVNSSGAAAAYWASIGLNVTANVETTPNGTWATGNIDNLDSAIGSTDYAEYEVQPFIGQTNANAIEGARANVQAFWAENNMRLTATVWS